MGSLSREMQIPIQGHSLTTMSRNTCRKVKVEAAKTLKSEPQIREGQKCKLKYLLPKRATLSPHNVVFVFESEMLFHLHQAMANNGFGGLLLAAQKGRSVRNKV